MAAAQTQQTRGKPPFFNASIARRVIRLTCFLTIPLSKTTGTHRCVPRDDFHRFRASQRDMKDSSENQPRRDEERTEGKSSSEPANFISITATPVPLATVSRAVQAKISYPV